MGTPTDASSAPDRARRLLRLYVEQREISLQHLASRLKAPAEEVAGRLNGSDPIHLDWVEKVLAALGVSPGEFFARLYSDEPIEGDRDSEASTTVRPESESEVLHRDEVEGLVREARALIRGATRMAEARAQADQESQDEPS